MYNYKPIDTHVTKDESLSLNKYLKTSQEKAKMNYVSYASEVGSLMYAMICIQLDIILYYVSSQLLSIESYNQILESSHEDIYSTTLKGLWTIYYAIRDWIFGSWVIVILIELVTLMSVNRFWNTFFC